MTMVEHAERELKMIGEDPDVIEGYLRVVQAFEQMGHSGASAAFAIPVITRLLKMENLKDLTNDPDEWIFHEEGAIWQNARNSEAFSEDGGKTYYLLSEVKIDGDIPIARKRPTVKVI